MAEPESFFEGFLSDYFAECDEHLAAATRTLLDLETSMGNAAAERAAIDDLFRYFHSLKGISAMVELKAAERLAHELESYLRAVRDRELLVSNSGIELMIEGTQRLERVVQAFRNHDAIPAIDDVVSRVHRLIPEKAPAPNVAVSPTVQPVEGEPTFWKCTFAPTRELLAEGVGVDAIRKRLAEAATIAEAAPEIGKNGAVVFQFKLSASSQVDLAAALGDLPVTVERLETLPAEKSDDTDGVAAAPAAASASPSQVVRVDLARLDDLMRSVGDLVISRARLDDALGRVERYVPPVEWRLVHENAAGIDRQLRTLREGIMRVRLVRMAEIFRRMPFVVRDLARETGKRVNLEIHGQTAEIDKFLIERMMDPVLHLVRNAVSHGIEPPAERIARGKRPEGTLTLGASTSGDLVTIEVSDDGRGIDTAAVLARARAAGLPVPAGTPDPSTLLSIICAPGFSTREDVDRASGRGVGMAVVKQTIEHLSGTLAVSSEPDHGTRFTIQLPLTLTITDALIVRVGPQLFAVPQGAVREVLEVSLGDLRAVEGNELAPYRDGVLPIVRLAPLFGLRSTEAERCHVFVTAAGAAIVGFAADRIVGQREIVVRTIVDPLVKVDGISGATDLGDGRVVLILDPAALAAARRTGSPVRRIS